MVVFCCIQIFRATELLPVAVPHSLKVTHVKQMFNVRGNVFQEGEHSVTWMLIAENVEYEPFFRDESVAVSWDPNS